jgi:hypothetical protein
MMGIPTQCMKCKHLARDGQKFLGVHCKAFPSPDFIPFEIWDEGFDHTKPFPGDHGVRFEPLVEPAVAESVSPSILVP